MSRAAWALVLALLLAACGPPPGRQSCVDDGFAWVCHDNPQGEKTCTCLDGENDS